tara:strand:- start:878 stop:1288 length:411 start_codon:yes stop_codon:yes gene_type:complete
MTDRKKVISKARKFFLTALGFVCVFLGAIGIVVPGLPTTVFMIIAAWLFSISNPRFEKWLLSLPKIGPAISSYRQGLGMPQKAKFFAITSIVVFSGLAILLLVQNLYLKILIGVVGLFGVGYILVRVPTREKIGEK